MRQRGLAQPEQGIDVGLVGGIELLGGQLGDVLHRSLLAGHVDQDVETAEGLLGLAHQLGTEGFVLQVTGHADHLAPFGFHQLHHFLGVSLFLGQVVEHQIRPFTGIGNGSRPANSRIRTRDQRLAASQTTEALVAGLAMVGTRLHHLRQARCFLRLLGKFRLGILGKGGLHAVLVVAGHDIS